jgi:hypothetical protein
VLGSLAAGGVAHLRTPQCPPEDEVERTAAGIAAGAEEKRILQHLIECDACAALFREATRIYRAEITDEEFRFLAALPSSGAPAQAKGTTQLRAGAPKRFSSLGLWHGQRWALAAGVLIAAGIGVWFVALRDSAPNALLQPPNRDGGWNTILALRDSAPNALLAKAYSEHRTLELRMEGARWSPLQVARGTRGLPGPALAEALAALARGATLHANDAAWLQAQARAHLLTGEPDAAIPPLDRARAFRPADPTLDVDLAS